MGRHGGGSRSGGSRSGGRSSGGSRGGGSGTRTSTKPFAGCYNRSYYDRRGRLHTFYTSNKHFGTQSGWTSGKIILLIFITLHMLGMLAAFFTSFIQLGGKVEGDKERIFISDNADLLTYEEEQEILELFGKVYEASGMPITLCTEDFTWKDYYQSLAVRSEELYYRIGYDEDAMIILFTAEGVNGFWDWEYDMYCGDDTVKCFSDAAFDKVLTNFQKGMAGQNLADALEYAFGSVMEDLGKSSINTGMIPGFVFLFLFYGIFYFAIIGGTKRGNDAYRYFQNNPGELSMNPMTMVYSACPNCGAANTGGGEVCIYCGSFLKAKEGNVTYVNPNGTGL